MSGAFLELVAKSLGREKFCLVDIGCSGGIDAVWRKFGDRLSAVAFDASAAECRRLSAEETHPDIRYVPGFVDIRPDHPFARRAHNFPVHTDTLSNRLSFTWAVELEAERLATASHHEKLKYNLWPATELADATKPIYAPEFLEAGGYTDVDFLKIDVDGPDLRILRSFEGLFERFGILAVRIEVCMFGASGDTVNSFHNTDRFMREQGYSLFRLDNRTYSTRALPAQFAYDFPAQTLGGRIVQAEAHYARDPASAEWKESAEKLSNEKLLKLMAVFSAWDQPDSAAELLLAFRSRLSSLIDIEQALDLLAAQVQPFVEKPLTYREYLARFASNPMAFDPQPAPPPNLLDRLQAVWVAVTDLGYMEKLRRLKVPSGEGRDQ